MTRYNNLTVAHTAVQS